MKRSSWIALVVSLVLIGVVAYFYAAGRSSPETFSPDMAKSMISAMQDAVKRKSVNSIMKYVHEDADHLYAGMKPNQLRNLLARAFFDSKTLRADCSNVSTHAGQTTTSVEFDLSLKNEDGNLAAEDYSGHINLKLQRVSVGHLFGLYHTNEWRIVEATTTGRDPMSMGQFPD